MDENKEGWGQLQTIGYAEKGARECIDAFLAHPLARLVDIRLVPFCGWEKAWCRAQLAAKYGSQYLYIHELGNIHKGTTRPIKLLNPERHILRIAGAIRRGKSVMLLCGCHNYEKCHRKTVYDLVMAALDLESSQPRQGGAVVS